MLAQSGIGHPTRNKVINVRAQEQEQNLIDYAASLVGKTRSEFILDASCREAEDVIYNTNFFRLDECKYQEFLAILDSPPTANEELRKLLKAKSPWDE